MAFEVTGYIYPLDILGHTREILNLLSSLSILVSKMGITLILWYQNKH